MAKTMIQVDVETRDKIKSLGKMGESYSQVLERLYAVALRERQRAYLMDTDGYVDVDDLK